MIITTRRSTAGSISDTLLTAFGWLGFLYLLYQGANSLATAIQGSSSSMPLNDPFIPTVGTLMFYVLIGCFNALLLGVWMKWRQTHEEALRQAQLDDAEDRLSLFENFKLSPDQVHHVQDSRVTILHHSADGDIDRLETDFVIERIRPTHAVLPMARAA